MSLPARRRFVVALDSTGSGELGLEMAQYLPSAAAAELVGLLVEDARLIEHAHAPLAREVAMSGRTGPLVAATLERQLVARAGAMRRHFGAAAERLGLRYAFEVARGEPLAELMRAAARADFMIVERATTALSARTAAELAAVARHALRSVLYAHAAWREGRDIVAVLVNESDVAVLDVALGIAQRTESPLAIVFAAGPGPARDAVATAAELALHAAGARAAATWSLARLSARALEPAVRNARLLVVPTSAGPAVHCDLLDALRVPLLVARP